MASILTQSRLREALDYDPSTGIFTWRLRMARRIHVGDRAGCPNPSTGYINIGIDEKNFLAHRLAFLWMTGKFPKDQTDHINGIRHDNRFCNLREATNSENMQNQRRASIRSKSGFLGVSRRARIKNPWRAEIKINGKGRQIGVFPTAEAAHAAYIEAKRKIHVFVKAAA